MTLVVWKWCDYESSGTQNATVIAEAIFVQQSVCMYPLKGFSHRTFFDKIGF